MAYIYKITNNVNGKIYVGKTNFTIEKRWKEHCRDAQKVNLQEVRPLYRAIKKYGIEHFSIEEIEQCSPEQAEKREQYWIGYYDGYSNGYNATKGGDGKLLYNHQQILELLNQDEYAIDIAKKIGCSVDIVRQVAKVNNITLRNKGNDIIRETTKLSVNCYDMQHNFIKKFDAIADAARWCVEQGLAKTNNGGVRSHIAEVCLHKRKSAYQHLWEYAD